MPDYPSTALAVLETRTSKGQANGYASLGPDGKVPAAQVSALTAGPPTGAAGGVLGGTYPNPTLAPAFLSIPQGFGTAQSGSAAIIGTGGSIPTAGVGVARVAPAGAVTGVILMAGSAMNPWLVVLNESPAASSVTFAAAGTSNVASGVACHVSGLSATLFVWSAPTNLWYPALG